MPKLTVTVITLNEGHQLAGALESVVDWVDEIVVVDGGSTDDTVEVARRYTDRVLCRDWPGFGPQKNRAASLATNDWILTLDSDERVTPALAASIQATLAGEPSAVAYRMRRLSWHLGRWIHSTDWYPDYQTRLYDRRRARWVDRKVHEGLITNGPVALLSGELRHYPYRSISDHLSTIDRYTTLWAEQSLVDGHRARLRDLVLRPPAAFLRNYLLRHGFRDGRAGLVISLMNTWYVVLKFAKLWELQAPDVQCPMPSPHPRKANIQGKE
ncbi:MAG: glycosyltransferase [Luteitalea sp.]|nr:glycosyltransferase [Luteitalea sp.]